jgi:hypothetical protein
MTVIYDIQYKVDCGSCGKPSGPWNWLRKPQLLVDEVDDGDNYNDVALHSHVNESHQNKVEEKTYLLVCQHPVWLQYYVRF